MWIINAKGKSTASRNKRFINNVCKFFSGILKIVCSFAWEGAAVVKGQCTCSNVGKLIT